MRSRTRLFQHVSIGGNQAADVTQPVGLVVSIPPLLRGVVISAISTNINGLRCRGRGSEKTNG